MKQLAQGLTDSEGWGGGWGVGGMETQVCVSEFKVHLLSKCDAAYRPSEALRAPRPAVAGPGGNAHPGSSAVDGGLPTRNRDRTEASLHARCEQWDGTQTQSFCLSGGSWCLTRHLTAMDVIK